MIDQKLFASVKAVAPAWTADFEDGSLDAPFEGRLESASELLATAPCAGARELVCQVMESWSSNP